MSRRLMPIAAMEKILRRAGASRITEGAKLTLREILVEKTQNIAVYAIRLASHAGRKTIKQEDVKLAAKHNN